MHDDRTDTAILQACAPFDPADLLDRLEMEGSAQVAFMHPSVFLRLACPICDRIDSAERTEAVGRLLDDGIPFSSFPELVLDVEGDDAFVRCHDGRHRAAEILARGGNLIPVLLVPEGEDGAGRGPAELSRVRRFHPQPHDEGDSYPGWDDEELEDRLVALRADRVLVAVAGIAQLRAALQPPANGPVR